MRAVVLILALVAFSLPAPEAGASEQSVDSSDRPVLIEIDYGEARLMLLGSDIWTGLGSGEVALPGDEIATGPDTRATLVFFDGSLLQIEHNTHVTILSSAVSSSGSTTVAFFQASGNTWSRVARLIDSESSYAVVTPSGVGLVRGTEFKTTVHPDGGMDVRTVEGVVEVSKAVDRPVVSVRAGEVTRVGPDDDDEPSEPEEFELNDPEKEKIEFLEESRDRRGKRGGSKDECDPDDDERDEDRECDPTEDGDDEKSGRESGEDDDDGDDESSGRGSSGDDDADDETSGGDSGGNDDGDDESSVRGSSGDDGESSGSAGSGDDDDSADDESGSNDDDDSDSESSESGGSDSDDDSEPDD